MLETSKTCGRGEDLVAYLYEEATPAEASDFENHLRRCDACRTELAAFGGVRQAIGDWRLSAFGPLAHGAAEVDASLPFDAAETSRRRRPASALAALREFFALSPAWMRAATVAFAAAFCALVVIAVAHLVERPQIVVVKEQIKSGYSKEDVDSMIAEAIKRQKEQATPEKIQEANDTQPAVVSQNRNEGRGAQPRTARNARAQRRATRPSAEPSTVLASTEYLPFTASQEDEELPSLADLVDDANEE
ncbi:MAG TPA: zf-HC2 domain-containing protein [Pyrinomonadaceae bacterium]|nr:zf-HC2 domain-containing protein [Pyrinomonadaceae bacterium]